jgi:hypothetical protein
MLKCAYYLFSSCAGFCQVDAARKGRNGQDNWMGEAKKKKNKEKKGNQLVNVCARNKH